MAVEPVKLAITKSTLWRGRQEEFSNIYTIHGLDKDSATARTALINAAVAAEKACHASMVSFIRAQIYSYGDFGPNFMYESTSLSGTGTPAVAGNIYKECATMLRAKMERSFSMTRSNQPYLRKYLHLCWLNGPADTQGVSAPTWKAPTQELLTYVNFLNNPGAGLHLGNDAGDEPVGDWEVCNFLEHRQFHRGRKEY